MWAVHSCGSVLSLNSGGGGEKEYVRAPALPLIQTSHLTSPREQQPRRAYFHLRNISRISNSLFTFPGDWPTPLQRPPPRPPPRWSHLWLRYKRRDGGVGGVRGVCDEEGGGRTYIFKKQPSENACWLENVVTQSLISHCHSLCVTAAVINC